MSETVSKRPYDRETDDVETLPEKTPEAKAKDEKLKADLDSLIDEIDEELTQNAEAMVRDFVQKGGE